MLDYEQSLTATSNNFFASLDFRLRFSHKLFLDFLYRKLYEWICNKKKLKKNKIILAFAYYCKDYATTFVFEKRLLRFFLFIFHYYPESGENFIVICVYLISYICVNARTFIKNIRKEFRHLEKYKYRE